MSELAAWFVRQAERERRVPCLADALLANRFWPYALYRLRYFFVRYVASVLVHAAKVLFLYYIFARRDFIAILVAHAAATLVTNFWWGALEEMRDGVRRLYRAGKPHLIGREIDRWLALSALLAAGTLAMGIGWLAWRIAVSGERFQPAQLYGLAIILRLSLDFLARAFHSGVYAIRRVYRPMWTLIGPELVGFAGFPLLAPFAGSWAFPISTIVGTLLVTALTWYYTRRSYRFLGVEPLQGGAARLPDATKRLGDLVAPGLSYALMKLDSFVVLGLLGSAAAYNGHELFLLFFVLSPTIQAGFDWAQLFYFDLKRLDSRLFTHLRQRYEADLVRLAWAVGFIAWALAGLTGTLFMRRNLGTLYWLIAPFFVSRSLLASIQIRAFSARRYADLLGNALLWLIGFAIVAAGATTDGGRLIGLSSVTVLTYLALRTREARRSLQSAGRDLRGLPEWLTEVHTLQEPVRIRWVSFAAPVARGADRAAAARRAHWAYRQIADKIARRIDARGAVTVPTRGCIVWYERGRVDRTVRSQWLAALGGGFLKSMGDTGIQADGSAALRAADSAGLPGIDVAPAAGREEPAVSRDVLKATFQTMFRDGVFYSADGRAPGVFDALTSKERRAIMGDAVAFARDFRPSRNRYRFDVTALCRAGALESIFVIDRRVDRSLRSRWRTLVTDANVRASVS